jgi:hypothetical protein
MPSNHPIHQPKRCSPGAGGRSAPIARNTAFPSPRRPPSLATLLPPQSDPDHSEGEEWFVTLGYSARNRLIVVCHTEKGYCPNYQRPRGDFSYRAHIGFEKHWRRCCWCADRSSRVLDCSGCCTSPDAWASTRKSRWTSDSGGCFGPSCVRYRRQFWRRTCRDADCRLPTPSPCVDNRRAACDIHVPGILKAGQQLAGLVSLWDGGGVRMRCGSGKPFCAPPILILIVIPVNRERGNSRLTVGCTGRKKRAAEPVR